MAASFDLTKLGQQAKQASNLLSQATSQQKNDALSFFIESLKHNREKILEANQGDIEKAKSQHLSPELIDRLSLIGRLDGMLIDIANVIRLPDPIGEIFEEQLLPNGLRILKKRVPIGVLGVIYESRPNVSIDIASLAIKTGNCAILRGGSETLETNKVLIQCIQEALLKASLPKESIQLIEHTDRQLVKDLLHLYDYVDLIIPRGGASLHRFCRENSQIPVITGGIGICHLFVDENVEIEQALSVILNAKTQRPTVCNALDTLLIHNKIAFDFIPKVIEILQPYHVDMRMDPRSWLIAQEFAGPVPSIQQASAKDWDTEWLSLVLGIKVVDTIDEAIHHIRLHSTGHSDGILTNDMQHAQEFINRVDSAAVYVNASTRFTDGSQLGLGAEVAISTQKLHARGPMGLKELTTYKWIIWGNYHTRK